MAQFFNNQGSCILVNHLVDSCHHTHLHQFLDELCRFHGHTFGKFINRDGFRNDDIMDNGRNRSFKTVFCFSYNLGRPFNFAFLALATLFSGDMQFLSAKQGFFSVRFMLAVLDALAAGFIGTRFGQFNFFS